MASNGSLDKIASANVAENSETTIEIKLKTLDSQTYTLRVDKQMPVPALKEQIASVTGVLSEQQRLICRGRVLKDDQLLSAYHVEDGHTLHLVVRQPPSSEGLSNHPATDPPSSTSRDHNGQMPSSVIIETVSLPEQGDGVPPEVSRIVAAVLGSFGLPNIGSGNSEGVDISRERGGLRTSAFSTTSDTIRLQPEHHGFMFQSDGSQGAFGLPTAVSLGSMHPPVFSDSLTTLSQYLSNIRRELEATGGDGENNTQADAVHGPDPNQRDSDSTLQLPIGQQRLPTPASLAEVLLSSRQLLINQIAERLSQLARLLENQANVTDPAVRSSTQSSVSRNGFILHKIGAFLLELGRTTMTVQLGQAPSEAVVNAGPAVFINPSGPNPLMVQPLPFQPATSFGAMPVGSVQPGSGLVNSIGTGLLPRRIDIQIRRGSSTATPNVNHEERGETQQPSGQRNTTTGASGENNGNETNSRVSEGSSFAGESGVRVVPIRSMVAAVPAPFSPLPSDPSGNIGLYYPVLGRFQNVASGQVNNGRGSQTSGEHNPAGVETEQQSTPEPAVQRQNVENQTRDGSLPASNSRQGHSTSRSINIILSAGTMQGNQESDRRVPNSVLQLLRSFIPGGEIRVEDDSLRGAAAGLVPENAGASNTPMESESRVSEEGIFLSNLLREIIPFVTQHGGAETNDTPQHQSARDSPVQAETSNAGTSHQRSDTESDQPNSKRQKTE